jgi:two-component system sensor histidine kinase UhpB
MSLRTQIGTILATLMAVGIIALTFQQIENTRQAVRDEVEGSNLIATQLLTQMSWLYSRAGVPAVVNLLKMVGHLRGNDVHLFDPEGKEVFASPPSPYKAGRDAPDWYARLVTPPLPRHEVPVAGGRLIIAADASRAVVDGWDDLVALVSGGTAVCLLIAASVFWLIRRALKPLDQVVDGLRQLEQGAYDTRLPVLAGAEANLMSHAFNRMAQAVEDNAAARQAASEARQHLAENRELTQMIQSHIEEERRQIARELHDELGQSITAVKSLGLAIVQRPDDSVQVGRAAKLIVDTAGQMYDAVHELIPRLRPFALDTFGLTDALQDLVADCRLRHPDIDIAVKISPLPTDLGDALTTCAYRIAQESLTNALRHSGGRRIGIVVATTDKELAVTIDDDGQGLPGDWTRPGHHGVRGMRERARALGGEFTIVAGSNGGTRVEVRLPLD